MEEVAQEEHSETTASDVELKFRTVPEAAIDAIILGDMAGNIIAWNAGAAAIFGYTEAEVMAKPLTILMPERLRGTHLEGLARLRRTGKRHLAGKTSELQAVRKSGDEFPIEISLGTWVTPSGRFFCGIIRDVTERKALEASLRQAALIDAVSELPNRMFLRTLRRRGRTARRLDGRADGGP